MKKIILIILVTLLFGTIAVWLGRGLINRYKKHDTQTLSDSAKIYKEAAQAAKVDYLRADSLYRGIITDSDRAEYLRGLSITIGQLDSIREDQARTP